MHKFMERPARMLLCLVGRHRGEMLVAAAKGAGARGGTLALGKSVGDNKFLQALSLADIQQDVVFIVMTDEDREVVPAVRKAALGNRKLAGLALVLRVPVLFLRKRAAGAAPDSNAKTRSKKMPSGHKLITVIVNSGYADDVMAVSRKAGASGGTILSARGTGTEEDVKFFGITLVPEKEMLFIVAEEDKLPAIVEAIGTVETLNEPGGGIVFSMDVEEFIPLGR
ncbi:MAG: P-II family nitrogen regulator [Planctomycetota bacterium]|jgi:nitrogen regulatory protein PII|nr:P-II family nitrogen regulator [Planctomycetota bacterium]